MQFLLILLAVLLPLNMVSLDPADYLILLIFVILIMLKFQTVLLNKLDTSFIYIAALFVGSFVVANFMGFEFRFTGAILINFALFIILYYVFMLHRQKLMFGYIVASAFVGLNVVFFALGLAGIGYLDFFEIFRDGRFLGTFGDPNFTGFTSIFVFIYFLDRVIENRSRAGSRMIDIVQMMLGAILLLLSESRSAWVASVFALLAYFAVMNGRRYKFVVPGFFLTLAMFMTVSVGDTLGNGQFGAITKRMQSIFVQNDSAEAERFQFLYSRLSAEVGMEHPLGVGPGMVVHYTGLTNADGMGIGSHNSFVQIFAELGWVAFGSLIIILGISAAKLLPRAIKGGMLHDVSYRFIFAMMVGQIVFAMAHDMIAWRISWVVPSMAICAAFARSVQVSRAPRERVVSPSRAGIVRGNLDKGRSV